MLFKIFKTTFLLVILSVSSYHISLAQKNKPVSKTITLKKDTTVKIYKIELVTIQSKPEKTNENWAKHMPWIASLSIGILAFVANIYISNISRKTSLEINKRDFNKTILSANRQLWINEFRSLIIEILTCSSYIISKQSISEEEFKPFSILLTKAEIMLDSENDKSFIVALNSLHKLCISILSQNATTDEFETQINIIKTQALNKIKQEFGKIHIGE